MMISLSTVFLLLMLPSLAVFAFSVIIGIFESNSDVLTQCQQTLSTPVTIQLSKVEYL